MTFVIATLVIILGVIIFSFTVSNIILITFFAIPFTKKLEKISLLKTNYIVSSYIIKLIIQIFILFATTTIFYIYFLNGTFISLMIGYAFGAIGIITKIKQFSLNMNNFSDYFEINKDYFWEELIAKYNEDKNKLLEFIVAASDKFDDNSTRKEIGNKI
ncbi:hypothetical protein CO051_00385 [Candidatus Roizmanbacteria bacterium CG_4_9_14_0_2_um_filter_39_13]|uniref:Uncharacterized protein n=1 Tax=Candidatus Roizmanbacteria bacterium CG_4_9_14_0_2_um_filter_39_13 TaxID=1974839 RepID=A0A2M8F4F7_9BACT|nr:MAG: hypothetical protein CO051_00385 [Candidatus Roizmanbacteria bacterium CG_4_9_14_0_2_um_filter_39_13]